MNSRRSITRVAIAAAAATAAGSSSAMAQLRIVTLNGANTTNYTGDVHNVPSVLPRNGTHPGQRQWMTEILTAIGATVSDDPTTANTANNVGFAKPLDILCLQESDGYATTGQGYANLLNSIYPTANYQVVPLDGGRTDPDPSTQNLVYNANTVSMVGATFNGAVGATYAGGVSTSGAARQPMRYQVRPVGYSSSSADVYIYSSHYFSSDKTRRGVEAQQIRNDADTLPANSNIIYLGDFNTLTSSEAMWPVLTTPTGKTDGTGTNHADTMGIDPVNKVGVWDSSTASNVAKFHAVYTQSPFDQAVATAQNTGFIGATGGMSDRFDWQLSTATVQDGHGFAYIPNTYQAFGNNGSQTARGELIDAADNTAQPMNILQDMGAILDHAPLVADYQLPAKQSVAVSIPSRVITGGAVQVNLNVANAAPVQFASGADTLTYSGTLSGAVSGSIGGIATALSGGNNHTLTLSTVGVGAKSGTISVNSSSESVENGSFNQNVNYTVIDHAQPSLAGSSTTSAASIDFGYVPSGFATRSIGFSVYNALTGSDPTYIAGMDVDGVTRSGSALMSTNVVATNPATPLAAGSALAYSASFTPDTVAGASSATHTIAVSDENIPGATARPNLVVTTTGQTLTAATFPATGFINLLSGETYNTGAFSIASGVTLTKSGPGTMNVNGAQSNGANSALAIAGGIVNMNTDGGAAGNAPLALSTSGGTVNLSGTQHLKSISATAGQVQVAAGGSNLVVADSVGVSGTGKIDLVDNKMIVHSPVGTFTAGNYDGVTGLVKTGRNGGSWTGNGIVTSMTAAQAATSLTTLAVASASDVLHIGSSATGTWNGETVTGTDSLIKYTYAGDANLSGKIDADDYFQIDSNYGRPGTPSYFKGDFNYDGVIDGEDYFLLDSNFHAQTAAFNAPALGGVSAVPEPTTALLFLGASAMARRRKRAKNSH